MEANATELIHMTVDPSLLLNLYLNLNLGFNSLLVHFQLTIKSFLIKS
jgi:hypothetical protein